LQDEFICQAIYMRKEPLRGGESIQFHTIHQLDNYLKEKGLKASLSAARQFCYVNKRIQRNSRRTNTRNG
jgi:hypothetical protein